jgi:hypothetical protein
VEHSYGDEKEIAAATRLFTEVDLRTHGIPA